jgi:TolB-like protein/DNA-binding winged helix-turn-helix (wHTH) protein
MADTFSVNGVIADLANETLTDAVGNAIVLRPQCFAVLRTLSARPNQLVTKDELMQAVWPDTAVTDDSLVQCIHEIRQALKDEDRTVLKTVPKRGYRLVLPKILSERPAADVETVIGAPALPSAGWLARRALIPAVSLALVVVAALAVWLAEGRTWGGYSPAAAPAVAVLPFDTIGGEAGQGFADGMTEDVITDLAKLSGISVVARNARTPFKDRPDAVAAVARELGLRYVLVGSVRRDADRVRINVHLVDAVAGHHLWAERYDGTLDDALALQDRVARNIVAALATQLVKADPAKDGQVRSTHSVAEAAPNRPPSSVVFENAVASLPANASTADPIRVADLSAVDDGIGTNVFSLSGEDATFFEIVGRSLYLKAGVTLDAASKAAYNLTVDVDDRSVGGSPDASNSFTLRLIQAAAQTGATRLD